MFNLFKFSIELLLIPPVRTVTSNAISGHYCLEIHKIWPSWALNMIFSLVDKCTVFYFLFNFTSLIVLLASLSANIINIFNPTYLNRFVASFQTSNVLLIFDMRSFWIYHFLPPKIIITLCKYYIQAFLIKPMKHGLINFWYNVHSISFQTFLYGHLKLSYTLENSVCYCYISYQMTNQFLWFQVQMNSYSRN